MSENKVTLSQLADSQALTATVQSQDVTTAAPVDAEPADTATSTVAESTPAVKAAKTVRKGIKGRPLDTAGVTTMGKAREIYAANPSYSYVQLRDAVMTATGCKKAVAATYASKVRSGAAKAAAKV